MDDEQYLEPMSVPPTAVALQGGPFDGQGYEVQPMFAVCLPDRMEFFSLHEGKAGWHGYERTDMTTGDTFPERAVYGHSGFRPMDIYENAEVKHER